MHTLPRIQLYPNTVAGDEVPAPTSLVGLRLHSFDPFRCDESSRPLDHVRVEVHQGKGRHGGDEDEVGEDAARDDRLKELVLRRLQAQAGGEALGGGS